MEAITKVLQTYDRAKPKIDLIYSGISEVSEKDLELLIERNARLYTFHYNLPDNLQKLADQHALRIHNHKVIYHLVDEIKEHLQLAMPSSYQSVELGRAEIQRIFKRSGRPPILGLEMISGELRKDASFRIYDPDLDQIIFEGENIFSLRHFQNEVDTITNGNCGVECFSTKSKESKKFVENVSNEHLFICHEMQFVKEPLNWEPRF